MKYHVFIARTETTLYRVNVEADCESEAEELAYDRFHDGDYDSEEIVYGEEDTHEIRKVNA